MAQVAVEVAPFTLAHFRDWALEFILDDGDRFELEPFQVAFLEDVFSGKRECWLVVPEGNGKTTLLAALALYHITFREEGYVAVAASARDQAEWIFRQAAGFVRRSGLQAETRSPESGEYVCLEGYRRIRYDDMHSRIQVFAADDRTGDGAIASLYILDELHRHKSLDLYRLWNGKLNKRPGAQIIIISTAGEPGEEFENARTLMRQSGEVDRDGSFIRAVGPGSVLHEWALPENGNPDDLEAVKDANPFTGVTEDELRRKYDSPTFNMTHWRRFVCNLPTRAEEAAITEMEWAAAKTGERIPEGQSVWLGLDLGWKYDTTALVPLWVRDAEFRLFGPATILEPPRNGDQLDAHLVEAALLRVHERNPIHTVVMDMTNGAQLSQWIEETMGARVVDRVQANTMRVMDYARFMEALREGWLKHSGDEGLTKHAMNAIAKILPGGDPVFDRPKQTRIVAEALIRRRVIDALVAAAMVHTTAAAELGEKPADLGFAFV